MATDLMSGVLFLFAIIFCIIIYLIIINILKFVLSFRFISRLVEDFKRRSKKYKQSKLYKSWQPWRYE